MSNKNKNKSTESSSQDEVIQDEKKEVIIPKDATIDVPVWVVSLPMDKYHDDGVEFQLGKKTAEKLVKQGVVKYKETEE